MICEKKKGILTLFCKINVPSNMLFGDFTRYINADCSLENKHCIQIYYEKCHSWELSQLFGLGWQWLLLPLGLFDLIFILSLFWVNLESSSNLNFHMGTCFSWMMCSANTFFPDSIHFKTVIKGIPEEHQTCLAYHCVRLQNLGSSNLKLWSSDRKTTQYRMGQEF